MPQVLNQEQLEVIANPTDTRLIPNTSKGQKLMDALGIVSGTLDSAIDSKVQQEKLDNEAAMKAGILNYSKETKDAVKEGIISEGQSEWYNRGRRTQRGRVDGSTYDLDMNKAYQEWEAKDSDDSKEFATFLGEFRNNWISTHPLSKDNHWQEGISPRLNAAEQQLSEKHEAYSIKRREEEVVENTYQEYYGAAVDGDVESMKAINSKQDFYGMKQKRNAEARVKAIIQAAIDTEDEDKLSLIDKTLTDGIKKSSTVRDLEERARMQIRRSLWQEEDRLYKVQERSKKQAKEDLILDTMNTLANGDNLSAQQLEEGSKIDPMFRKNVVEWKKSVSPDYQEDAEDVERAAYNIYSGNWSMDDLNERAHLYKPATFLRFADDLAQSSRRSNVLQAPTFRRMESNIRNSLSGLIKTPEASRRQRLATNMLYSEILRLNEDESFNPNSVDGFEKMQEIEQKILNQFERQQSTAVKRTYDPATDRNGKVFKSQVELKKAIDALNQDSNPTLLQPIFEAYGIDITVKGFDKNKLDQILKHQASLYK